LYAIEKQRSTTLPKSCKGRWTAQSTRPDYVHQFHQVTLTCHMTADEIAPFQISRTESPFNGSGFFAPLDRPQRKGLFHVSVPHLVAASLDRRCQLPQRRRRAPSRRTVAPPSRVAPGNPGKHPRSQPLQPRRRPRAEPYESRRGRHDRTGKLCQRVPARRLRPARHGFQSHRRRGIGARECPDARRGDSRHRDSLDSVRFRDRRDRGTRFRINTTQRQLSG